MTNRPNPELLDFGYPFGQMWLFYTLDDFANWKVYENYKERFTPEQSNGMMLVDTWKEMIEWCRKNARGEWWNDHISSIAFSDEGDAIRFKLTFV